MTRNTEIFATIEAKKFPILPFELELAQRGFMKHVERQEELGKQMGEAMNQTSETWHDNAAADAVTSESGNLAKSANHLRRIIHESTVFSYEANPEEGITLGSLVEVRFGASDEVSHVYITGSTRELTEEIEAELPEVEDLLVTTVHSPMGKSLIGLGAGQSTQFNAPNGRTITVHVGDFTQVTLPSHSTSE